jgi:hypothetical protein
MIKINPILFAVLSLLVGIFAASIEQNIIPDSYLSESYLVLGAYLVGASFFIIANSKKSSFLNYCSYVYLPLIPLFIKIMIIEHGDSSVLAYFPLHFFHTSIAFLVGLILAFKYKKEKLFGFDSLIAPVSSYILILFG